MPIDKPVWLMSPYASLSSFPRIGSISVEPRHDGAATTENLAYRIFIHGAEGAGDLTLHLDRELATQLRDELTIALAPVAPAAAAGDAD
jgi:hypothetical protein